MIKLIPTKSQWKKWTLPTKISVIGTVIGVLSFGTYAIEKTYNMYAKIENPPPKNFLYGTWEANEIEEGIEVTILWHLKKDGTTTYEFIRHSTIPYQLRQKYMFIKQSKSSWYYNDGLIYEKTTQVTYVESKYNRKAKYYEARSIIHAIDKNTFELTIVDNDNLESRGNKRVYKRVIAED
ncbi:hypothetical protein Q4512_13025 [Oceanihabitans sp. 2_MG-2023]|uniref:hypothetical protein n=1 Tax=Oceanihabitans sp. 2_MG-2023 TaxID=3062661 RepID=UPI0026E14236|nr:hypothetical protein [Oceanihabitans sp. 2_MG-2023]MDO6597841.1 hypothetical protein [Oceanihabitans sp. 2_MG-2023]